MGWGGVSSCSYIEKQGEINVSFDVAVSKEPRHQCFIAQLTTLSQILAGLHD